MDEYNSKTVITEAKQNDEKQEEAKQEEAKQEEAKQKEVSLTIEELLKDNNKLLKQQLLLTRVMVGMIGLFIVALFVGGNIVSTKMQNLDTVFEGISDMTTKVSQLDVEEFNNTIQEFGDKVSKLDIDGLNESIDTLNNMATKVDEVNRELELFTSKYGFLFGG